jgi:hypothetical protein
MLSKVNSHNLNVPFMSLRFILHYKLLFIVPPTPNEVLGLSGGNDVTEESCQKQREWRHRVQGWEERELSPFLILLDLGVQMV